MVEIPSTDGQIAIVDLAAMAEIAENLYRREITALERAVSRSLCDRHQSPHRKGAIDALNISVECEGARTASYAVITPKAVDRQKNHNGLR